MSLADRRHAVTIESIPARCDTPGHYDTMIKCSCGDFAHVISHGGNRDDVVKFTTAHRIRVIEARLDIKFTQEHI